MRLQLIDLRIVLLLCRILAVFGKSHSSSSLRAVSLLFRHGDRAPVVGYPNDPHLHYPWPDGYGSLTQKGCQQLYNSGLIKSVRYSSLFGIRCYGQSCSFNFDKIFVQSSGKERCVSSARYFLDGFIRVSWSPNLIRVTPKKEDELLTESGKPCPKYDHVMHDGPDLNDTQWARIVKSKRVKGMNLLDYLEYHTGMNINTTFQIAVLEDTLRIQMRNGLKLPSWTKHVYTQFLKPITSILYDIWGSTRYMQIRCGGVLKDIVDRLERYIEGSSGQNVLVYSGHDVTLNAMFQILNIRNQTVSTPSYGATIAMELHRNQRVSKDFEIKIFYYSDYGDEYPIQIKMPYCKAPCPFRRFKKLVKDKFTVDYDKSCSQ